MIHSINIKALGAMGAFLLLLSVPKAMAQHEHDAPDPMQTAVVGEPINTMCPVTTDEEADPSFTAEYEGQIIGFCCRKCRTRFEKDPVAYLSELPMLQAVSQAVQTDPMHEDLDGHDHAHEEIVEDAHEHAEHAEHAEGEQHDHATDHGKGESGLSKLIAWIGKFHPLATHLPIGLLIGAALAEGLFVVTKRECFMHATAFCVGFGVLGVLSAATLGWFNGGFVLVDDDWVQLTHRWLGTGTMLMTLVAGVLLLKSSRKDNGAGSGSRMGFRVALFTTVIFVSATGFFGGALVYGINHYAW